MLFSPSEGVHVPIQGNMKVDGRVTSLMYVDSSTPSSLGLNSMKKVGLLPHLD